VRHSLSGTAVILVHIEQLPCCVSCYEREPKKGRSQCEVWIVLNFSSAVSKMSTMQISAASNTTHVNTAADRWPNWCLLLMMMMMTMIRLLCYVCVVMELVGRRYRTVLGSLIMTAFGLGYMLQPCLAFVLRDDTWYQLASSAASFVYPLVILCVSAETLCIYTDSSNQSIDLLNQEKIALRLIQHVNEALNEVKYTRKGGKQ